MSDLKNVLKAGFLVTASLFATGCGNNEDKAADPVKGGTGGTGGGAGSGTSGGVSSPSVKSSVPTFVLDMKPTKEALYAQGLAAYEIDKKIQKDPVKGYGADFDILAALKPVTKAQLAAVAPTPAATPGVATFDAKTLLELVAHVSPAGESFDLKFTNTTLFPADKSKRTVIGGLILDGRVDDKARSTVMAKVTPQGTKPVETNLVILRSAVLTAAADAVISTPYAYVGIDAAIGYAAAREDAAGKAIDLPITVHSTPTDSASKLSAGTAKTSQAKPATALPTVNKANAVAAPVKAPTAPGKKLTLKMVGSDSSQAKMLNEAGLNVGAKQGTLDIGGRVAVVDASNVVISAISSAEPELVAAEGVVATLAVVTKATSTATTAAAKSAATKDKNPVPQGTVTKADGTKGHVSSVKPAAVNADGSVTGLYAEIGELKVGVGTEFQALPHHSLMVHTLDLTTNDLGVSVFVQTLHDGISLTKLNTITWVQANAKDGQGLMNELADQEKHPISKFGKTDDDSVHYSHYDSFTPFPLWVADVKGTTKGLTLSHLTLDAGVALDAGVYVYPLVKDLSKKLINSFGVANITLAADESVSKTHEVTNWKIIRNDHNDVLLVLNVTAKAPLALSSGAFDRALMSSKAQGGRSVASATLDAVVAKLDPTNLVSTSFAGLSSSRLNQASQIASLARGVNGASAEKLGAVEQYAVTFNHAGARFGLTYNLDGGNAFSSSQGTTSFGANVASDVLGLKAIVSAEASVDAGKNAYAASSLASYNAGVTFAKAYNLGGLSVVPMGGFGVSSNALNSYSAVVPMAAGMLGLSMNDVSFTAATFHAGVNLALDDFVATATGATASLTFGVAGYLASTASATLSTSEGKSSDLSFGGDAVTPYAQFNLGFATGEKLNTMISSGIAAVNFGLDR